MRKTIGVLGQVGLVKDQQPEELPGNAWSDSRNVRFSNGNAQRFQGHSAVFDPPSGIPRFLQPLEKTDGTKFWIYPTLTTIYAHNGTSETDVTGTTCTGSASDKWTGGVIAGQAILNNGVDPPQFWNGDTATNFATLTGWQAAQTCKSMRVYRNYLVAMNVTKSAVNYPHMVKISDAADPGAVPLTWVPANTNDAEERDLAETPGYGVDSLALGDIQILYKTDSYYGLQFTGGELVFRTWLISNRYGMLSQNCAAEFPGGHIVLGAGDVYTHSGGAPTSILEGRMKQWLFSQIDTDYRHLCFVVANPRKSEAWICYPDLGSTSCTSALVWNWKDDTFAVRDLPNVYHGNTGRVAFTATDTWEADSTTWEADNTIWDASDFSQAETRLLMCSADTKNYIFDQGYDFGSTTTTRCYVERQGLAFDDPWIQKTLASLFLRLDASDNTVFSVYIGAQQQSTGSVTWKPVITYTNGTSLKADGFVTGRFIAIRIECTTATAWRLRSYDAEYELGGMY